MATSPLIQFIIPDFAKAFQKFSIECKSQIKSLIGFLEEYCTKDAYALFLSQDTQDPSDGIPPSAIRLVMGCLWHLDYRLKEMTKRMNNVETLAKVYLPEIIILLQQSQPEGAKNKATLLLSLMVETEDKIIDNIKDMYTDIQSAIEASQDPQLSHIPNVCPFFHEFDQQLGSLHGLVYSNFDKHWDTMDYITRRVSHPQF